VIIWVFFKENCELQLYIKIKKYLIFLIPVIIYQNQIFEFWITPVINSDTWLDTQWRFGAISNTHPFTQKTLNHCSAWFFFLLVCPECPFSHSVCVGRWADTFWCCPLSTLGVRYYYVLLCRPQMYIIGPKV
jgi:hypothetical protein